MRAGDPQSTLSYWQGLFPNSDVTWSNGPGWKAGDMGGPETKGQRGEVGGRGKPHGWGDDGSPARLPPPPSWKQPGRRGCQGVPSGAGAARSRYWKCQEGQGHSGKARPWNQEVRLSRGSVRSGQPCIPRKGLELTGFALENKPIVFDDKSSLLCLPCPHTMWLT